MAYLRTIDPSFQRDILVRVLDVDFYILALHGTTGKCFDGKHPSEVATRATSSEDHHRCGFPKILPIQDGYLNMDIPKPYTKKRYICIRS